MLLMLLLPPMVLLFFLFLFLYSEQSVVSCIQTNSNERQRRKNAERKIYRSNHELQRRGKVSMNLHQMLVLGENERYCSLIAYAVTHCRCCSSVRLEIRLKNPRNTNNIGHRKELSIYNPPIHTKIEGKCGKCARIQSNTLAQSKWTHALN